MEDILNDIKDKILEFKKTHTLINGEFLSKHLKVDISHQWVTYRDPDKNWFSKDFYAGLDKESIPFELNQNDGYPSFLLGIFRECYQNEPYNEIDDTYHLNELVDIWKRDIIYLYNRTDHIKHFVWSLLPYIQTNNDNRNCFFEQIFTFANEHLSSENPIQYKEFETSEFLCEIVNFNPTFGNVYREVMVKGLTGVWGKFVAYKNKKSLIQNCKNIIIPEQLYAAGKLWNLKVTCIGEGLFNNLTQVETIEFPNCIKHAKWSFWHCRKLKEIIVKPYGIGNFCSIDGVLFSGDKKTLIAYPNMHGINYSVPSGVEKIANCAFKDCILLEELHLPESINHIGLNAFYRCINLKKIICEGSKDNIEIDGFYGAYGDLNFEWIFLK